MQGFGGFFYSKKNTDLEALQFFTRGKPLTNSAGKSLPWPIKTALKTTYKSRHKNYKKTVTTTHTAS